MDPSASKSINPLVDLHQQKKQQRQQQRQRQQQHFIYTNSAIHPGQYDHPSPQDPLPSLSHLMHNSVPIVSSSLPLQPSLSISIEDHQLEIMPQNVNSSKSSKVSFSNMESSPAPKQMKQPNYIYQPDDAMYANNNMNPLVDGFRSNQQKVNHSLVMNDNSLTFYQRSVVDVYPPDPTHSTNNPATVETFYSNSTQAPNVPVQATSSLSQPSEDQHKIYSFIPLDVISQQKRPRKKYNEVERLYQCTYLNCTKAYGTLNHLNAHVTMQGHGPKRLPIEFKELRRQLKKNRQKQQPPKTRKNSSQKQSKEQQNYQRFSLGNAVSSEQDEKGEGSFQNTNVGGPQPSEFSTGNIMENNPIIRNQPTYYSTQNMPLTPLQQQQQQQQTFPPPPSSSSASYRQQFQNFGMLQSPTNSSSSAIHQPRF